MTVPLLELIGFEGILAFLTQVLSDSDSIFCFIITFYFHSLMYYYWIKLFSCVVDLSLFILTSTGFPRELICPTNFIVKLFRAMLTKLDWTGKEKILCTALK